MREWLARLVRDDRGFSLTELTIAGALIILVSASALTVLESGARTERGQRARAEAVEDQRIAFERLTKELRQAISVDTASTRSTLIMTTLIEGVEHDVTYDVVDGTLRRSVDGGTAVPVLSGLTSSEVFCYDPSDCLLSSPDTSTPALVRVSLDVRPDTQGAPAVPLEADIHLRNQ